MQYLFDSSAIYALAKKGKTRLLVLSNTCDLARYELGNILITEAYIRRTIGETEQRFFLHAIVQALSFMNKINAEGNEQEIIDLSAKYDLSFYDASYAYLAKKSNSVLVTEDGKLAKKIRAYVTSITASEFIGG